MKKESKKAKKEETKKGVLNLYKEEEKEEIFRIVKTGYHVLGKEIPTELEDITKQILDNFIKEQRPIGESDEYGRIPVRRLNIYTDQKGNNLITVDIHLGTTPLVLKHPSTGKLMRSLCYIVPLEIKPTAEWYAPNPATIATMPEELKRHCYNGGLILRMLGNNTEGKMKNNVKFLTNKKQFAEKTRAEVIFYLKARGGYFTKNGKLDQVFINLEQQERLLFLLEIDKNHKLNLSIHKMKEGVGTTIKDLQETKGLPQRKEIANLQAFEIIYENLPIPKKQRT